MKKMMNYSFLFFANFLYAQDNLEENCKKFSEKAYELNYACGIESEFISTAKTPIQTKKALELVQECKVNLSELCSQSYDSIGTIDENGAYLSLKALSHGLMCNIESRELDEAQDHDEVAVALSKISKCTFAAAKFYPQFIK